MSARSSSPPRFGDRDCPLRVLIITPTYPAPDHPHHGSFIHRQVVNLARAGVECRVLSLRPAPPTFPRWLLRRGWLKYYAGRLRWAGPGDGIVAETVFYPRRWTTGEDVVPAMGQALVKWIEQRPSWQETDIIYAQFMWTAGAAALALRERFGWPIAAIARGGEMEQWHATNLHCRSYVEKVLREIDRPLANCAALRDKAERIAPGSARRMEVVYNGCDADLFRPNADRVALRRTLGIADNQRVAVFCGSIEQVKGIQELVDAWARFSRAHAQWQLVVIGRRVERELVEQLKALPARVTLTGELSQPEVLSWLQAADLYVQPSRLEGLANATMEAMAAGLPVIATDVGGQRELIRHGENGWLLPFGDPAPLLAALTEAAAEPAEAHRRGVAARRTIQELFDAREQAERLVEILKATVRQAATA